MSKWDEIPQIEAIKLFWHILGGDPNKMPNETADRILRLKDEFNQKRKYLKFTAFESKVDEMVIINKIKVFSFCEHHLLPFFGYCSIAYIPNGKILGLSKFQRLVDKFASKPSTQENLTDEIACQLEGLFDTKERPLGIGVAMTCIHTCMFGRGINTSTITVNSQVMRGALKTKPEARAEFLSRINGHEDLHC